MKARWVSNDGRSWDFTGSSHPRPTDATFPVMTAVQNGARVTDRALGMDIFLDSDGKITTHYAKIPAADEIFWERVAVALAVGDVSHRKWALACNRNGEYFRTLRNRSQRPRPADVEALCTLTGCSVAFLDNPEPIDLSR